MKSFPVMLARVMVAGTLIAAAVIAAGLIWYLPAHRGEPPGDHIFRGEPVYLENPFGMAARIFDPHALGERRSLIMAGLFLLLLNPVVRVLLAAAGYLLEKDRLYALVSAAVLGVLLISFFW